MFARLPNAKRNLLALATGFALGAAATVSLVAYRAARPEGDRGAATDDVRSAWGEVKWPLPADLWSVGKAFKCRAADCGSEVTLHLRAKIGFCNCTTGVADDEELERLADIRLFGGKHSADGPGRPIMVAWMKGRSRSYSIAGISPGGKSALVIAFNDRCDAIVGTAIVSHDRPAAVEQAVIDFLNGDVVLKWAQVTLETPLERRPLRAAASGLLRCMSAPVQVSRTPRCWALPTRGRSASEKRQGTKSR